MLGELGLNIVSHFILVTTAVRVCDMANKVSGRKAALYGNAREIQ
jgi:hypothetical protein